MQCEISGELIATSTDEAVVTPSGHVCLKHLLLTKLTENGGVDPFVTDTSSLPLTEDQLVTLATSSGGGGKSSSSQRVVPPRPTHNSIPGLLQTFRSEYDAVALELFDTRQALEETRRELSQALYQNDAALRVVARMALERDQARAQLQEWNAANHGGGGGGNSKDANKKRKLDDTATATDDKEESSSSSLMVNDIPPADFESLQAAWKQLQPHRKAWQKQAQTKSTAPTTALAKFSTQAWHATTCKGLTALQSQERHGPPVVADISHDDKKWIVTAGKDKTLCVYDPSQQQVVATLDTTDKVTCVDLYGSYVAAALTNGTVQVWDIRNNNNNNAAPPLAVGTISPDDDDNNKIVSLDLHPNGRHLVVTVATGKVILIRINHNDDDSSKTSLQVVSVFQPPSTTAYTAGRLHPDGLVHVAATPEGTLQLWDFNSKTLAATFQDGSSTTEIVDVQVSPNGYHIASVHADSTVRVWDMRKQKCLAVLNQKNDNDNNQPQHLSDVTSVTFDPAGKYVAYSGLGGVNVVTVKEWNAIAAALSSSDKKTAWSGVVWTTHNGLVLHGAKQRQVGFFQQEES